MSASYQHITGDLQRLVLSRARVPEHAVPMMAALSGGRPFVAGDYLMFHAADWLIFIGYPLGRQCGTEDFSGSVSDAARHFNASDVWFTAPAIPPGLIPYCRNQESDSYYRLDCTGFEIPRPLRRCVEKASLNLTVECGRNYTAQHEELSARYCLKMTVPPRVKALYTGIRKYVESCDAARVLSAWDHKGSLAAFFIVDLSASAFSSYLIGGHSSSPCTAHASDLLFYHMVTLSQEYNKDYIHLGLGVNSGIRRFKMKWGGAPFLDYRCAEYRPPGGIGRVLRSLLR